ncbi:MAG: M57 family metalloprotease [Myxococcaceae bacterium]
MNRIVLSTLILVSTACGTHEAQLAEGADEQLTTGAGLSWQAFQALVFQEPETGVYIADGDTPFDSEKQLREFYDLNVAQGQLIINTVGTADDRWTETQKANLTYCVSNAFGSNKQKVITAMASATEAWSAVANVKYVYVATEDVNCTKTNNNVVFDVNPVNAFGTYLARAFFPSTARSSRNVLIEKSAFTSTGTNFTGVLRHELGHTLGFRHEHTRPEAGTCFEDKNWRVLTEYDSASVMHYPQCNGTGSFASLDLTDMDKQGAAQIYGAPGSTPPNPPPTNPPATPTTETFSGSLAQGKTHAYGPFDAAPGTTFKATLSGTGDGDLYVRFGSAPSASQYNCRPYLDRTGEECMLTVPAASPRAFINVVGYAAATYSLKVTYTKP